MNTWKIAQFNIRQSLIWKPWPPSSQTKQFSIFDCQHCRLLFQNRMQCRTHLAAKKSFAKKLLASCANSWCKTSKRYFPNLIHILIAINFRMPRATKLSWSKKIVTTFLSTRFKHYGKEIWMFLTKDSGEMSQNSWMNTVDEGRIKAKEW